MEISYWRIHVGIINQQEEAGQTIADMPYDSRLNLRLSQVLFRLIHQLRKSRNRDTAEDDLLGLRCREEGDSPNISSLHAGSFATGSHSTHERRLFHISSACSYDLANSDWDYLWFLNTSWIDSAVSPIVASVLCSFRKSVSRTGYLRETKPAALIWAITVWHVASEHVSLTIWCLLWSSSSSTHSARYPSENNIVNEIQDTDVYENRYDCSKSLVLH